MHYCNFGALWLFFRYDTIHGQLQVGILSFSQLKTSGYYGAG